MIRKLILGTASVLALGIGGAALNFPAAAGDPNAAPGNFSKDDIRRAQIQLYTMGFYDGSLDGVVGSETKRAILAFQKSNDGVERTGTLDQQTADALIGGTVVGQGSSMTNSSGTSDFGAGQK